MPLPMPSKVKMDVIRRGVVIPACPLALDGARRLDERHQRGLLRYYVDAGAGGVAVGVHTTQFGIRDPSVGLLEPLLKLAAATIDEASEKVRRPIVRIAGVCGRTPQAVAEAELAVSLGYDLALVSLAAMKEASEDELLEHCRAVGGVIALMGFYLQPAVGGRILPQSFWRRFVEIENVVAIKVAPFNRYRTLDVVRAVALSGREEDVTLYTGNDDNIIMDLLTPYPVETGSGVRIIHIRGGLLGQWSVWTKKAVELLESVHTMIEEGNVCSPAMLMRSAALTDANGAIFDGANDFVGCIAGINEVLRRQGLVEYSHCLDANVCLSRGQVEEIERVCRDYPWLTDDEFVRENLERWLG